MLIPRELKRNLSRFEQELANRRQMIGPGIVLYGCSLLIFSRHPNGCVRAVPFLMGPLVAALFLTIRPYNPYKSLFSSLQGISPGTVEDDWAAQRLLKLLRSGAARRMVWKAAILVCISFVILGWVGSTLADSPTSWDRPYFGLIVFVLLQALLSLGPILHFLLRWAIREWQADGQFQDHQRSAAHR